MSKENLNLFYIVLASQSPTVTLVSLFDFFFLTNNGGRQWPPWDSRVFIWSWKDYRESPSELQVPSGGGVAFKLHYFQVDTAPVVFGILIWGFLSNFHKQNKSGSGNSTIRVCYHQNQIFDDQPHSALPGVSLSKLDTRERTDAGELSRTNCNPASHHLVG